LFNPDNFTTPIYDALNLGGYKISSCTTSGTEEVNISTTTGTGTIVYTNCINPGKTFHGTVHLTNPSLNNSLTLLTTSVTFSNLNVTTSLGTFTLSGGYNLTATNPNSFTPSFRANGIGAELTIKNGSGQTEIISDFDFTYNFVTSTTTTYASDFTLASSKLGGSFRHLYSVAIPYEKNSGTTSPFPYSGDAIIQGLNPTKLKVSVVGNGIIRQDLIQVDRSNDGINYPDLGDYTWALLNAP
jgi:hypothetical protein